MLLGFVLLTLATYHSTVQSAPPIHHGHSHRTDSTTSKKTQLDLSPHHHPTSVNLDRGKPDASIVSTESVDDHLPKPPMSEHELLGSVIIDRLEMVNARSNFAATYDWQAWLGYDHDKALIRAEGEIGGGQFKNARNELLWAHALTAFWDSQIGMRYDSGLGAERTWGAFGVQGFAPYWIYIEATAYIGEDARTALRLEMEYDLLFTQKLILQPRIEMNFYSRRDPSRLVSSGLSNIEAGLRLRYEFIPEFAPYLGIEWASTFGSAADIIRTQGNKAEETRFIVGVHFWF